MIGVRGSGNPDSRLPGKELVLGLEVNGRHAAVPLDTLRGRAILLTNALDRPIVITRTAAYDRRAAERTLTFEPADAQRLVRISAKTVYCAIWAKFHPESEIVKP